MRKIGLSGKIIIALVIGAVVGLIMNIHFRSVFPYFDEYLFTPLGKIFINLILMLVVPLVFFSIAVGTASIGNPKKLGRIGAKTMLYFLVSVVSALILGIGLTYLFKPGLRGEFDLTNVHLDFDGAVVEEQLSLMESLINIIPTNPIQAMGEGNMLQIITFSVLIGLAMAVLGEKTKRVYEFFEQANEIMMYLIRLVMKLAPYGTFGLIASNIGKMGIDAMEAMGIYMITVLLALVIHFFVFYGGSLALLAGVNPFHVFKEYLPAMNIAFSSSSSSAALPIAMDIAQNRLGVPKAISSFVQPIGATINMDGTAIMQAVATVFIAQVVGSDLTIGQQATIVITAVLASVGTASVPGVGLVMLIMVLQSVNLPVAGIGLIIGIDRILDMARTALNSTGDVVCAVIVSESEKRREARRAEKRELQEAI